MSKKFDKRLILNRIKMAFDLKSDADLARFLGVKSTRVANWASRDKIDYEIIFTKCDLLSFDWLITGEGKVFKDSVNSSVYVGNNGSILSSQLAGGNNINVSLPDSGTQKIIDAKGNMKITSTAKDIPIPSNIEELLKKRISDLEKIIAAQTQTISTQGDYINVLKNK